MKTTVVTAWVTEAERDAFLKAWNLNRNYLPEYLLMQRDEHRDGCGATKNKGILRAMEHGADVVIVLDGDCYPCEEAPTLRALVSQHLAALEPKPVKLFKAVTHPASRGTPYGETVATMPVAASMGFWLNVPDYCGVRQLAHAAAPMTFHRETVFGSYFPLCGMNVAFRPRDWMPWWQFIEVSRFDDIWMGWLWQKEAYRRGYCFNLNGPLIWHSRQSNVWNNLRDEVKYLRETETLWREIALHPSCDYAQLLALLPTGTQNLATSNATADRG